MFLFALLSLIFSQSGALSSKYYCPRYEDILLGQICYRPLKNVLKRNDAESLCTSLNKKLPDTSVDQISGWLQSTTSTRNLITEDYCVYAYSEPQGVLSPDNPIYNLALCSTELPVLCYTLLQTGWLLPGSSSPYTKDVDPATPDLLHFNPRTNTIEIKFTWKSPLPEDFNFVVLTFLYKPGGVYVGRTSVYYSVISGTVRVSSLRLIAGTGGAGDYYQQCYDDTSLQSALADSLAWYILGSTDHGHAFINNALVADDFTNCQLMSGTDGWDGTIGPAGVTGVRVAVHDFGADLSDVVKIEYRISVADTDSSCESGWSEALRDTYKYCVQPSVKTMGGGELLTEDICPKDTAVFEFDYQTPTDDLTYTTTEESLPKLLKPFWTPYYLRSGKTVHRYTKVEARSLESCLYKFTNTGVSIMPCDKELPFHCQSPAKHIAEEQHVDPDTYDPVKEYLCEEDEILCENKCYQHRKVYETLDKASVNCTEGGYKLVTRNVPCIDYQSGWVEGSFQDGRLKIKSSQSLDSLCGYVEAGETKLGDCRMKAKVLCQVTLKSLAEACPTGYTKCSKKTECAGASTTSEAGLSWSEAIHGIHVCGNGGRLLDSRSSLEDCKAAIPTNAALWVGASLSKGNVVEFSSGEEVTISTPKKCLQVRGGKLLTSDCGDLHYFACERLAEVKDEETSSTDTAIVVTLIISPLVLIAVVLLLLYKKKGKQMCLSDTTADLGPAAADTGLTIVNPIIDEEQVIIEPVEDEGSRAEGSMEKSREMKEKHVYVNRPAGASGEKSLEVESEYEYMTTSIGANPSISANPYISANPSLGTNSSIRAKHDYVNRADI